VNTKKPNRTARPKSENTRSRDSNKPAQKPAKAPSQQSVEKKPSNTNSKEDSALGERIQKILARGGIGSRREVEGWIAEGRIKVNGVVATLGTRLKANDVLLLNDRIVNWDKFVRQETRVVLYHKPVGEVVTRNDPQGRPIIFKKLPPLLTGRWIAVGRLDINTSGLILVTNNGELANRLMHPSTQVEREYAVRILGHVSDAMLERLKQGVELEDGKAKFDEIYFAGGEGANKWYNVIVSEGRNRLVRRLWESQEVVVSRLMRVRYGSIVLPEGLRQGHCYEINSKEMDLLFQEYMQ
jgi:23S rRNA pseudouridine2605 synthase